MEILSNLTLLWRNPRLLAFKVRSRFGRVFLHGSERYLAMQKGAYERAATDSRYGPVIVDHVVGAYEAHNSWPDYQEYLMRYAKPEMLALDFGCGPGRNLIRWHGTFRRIDGADISPRNIENARINLAFHGIPVPELFVTSGADLGSAVTGTYDFIFSTITMQHICVHEIRRNIFADMFRALKNGGRISIQMGFGANSPASVAYRDNNYDALGSNRVCDTRVETPDEIREDLESIGFSAFESWVRPTGPGDLHPNWIYFTALKA